MRRLLSAFAVLLLGTMLGFAREPSVPFGWQEDPPRNPVLLVPGWLGHAQDLSPLKERLVRDGWEEEWVFPVEFQDPVGSSIDHAKELDQALEAVLADTGARNVDIVAHSMGGLAVWVLLQGEGSDLPVSRVVFLATPFQGTLTAYLAWGEGGPEMIPGSDLLERLQQGGWPQQWADVLSIRTPLDLTVVPSYQTTMVEMGDRVICCPTHQGLLDHEETYLVIREFLLGRKTQDLPASSGL